MYFLFASIGRLFHSGPICLLFQIAPTELEAVLLGHEAIGDAGVIGIPDEVYGAVPHAWVVLHPEMSLTEKELQKWVEGKVVEKDITVSK